MSISLVSFFFGLVFLSMKGYEFSKRFGGGNPSVSKTRVNPHVKGKALTAGVLPQASPITDTHHCLVDSTFKPASDKL